MTTTWTRTLTTAALAVAGVAFAAYPALRPYSDETSAAGADAMASGAWVAAHTLGMIGFVTLTLGVWALGRSEPSGLARRAWAAAAGLTWLGVSLVLPYYGAETFGLQVIAERAATTGDTGLLQLAETFRYGAVPLAFFATGLIALAAAGVALALAVRRTAPALRAGGWLVALGLVTYLPQFFLGPQLRIAHGALLGLGCLLVAVSASRARGTAPAPVPA